MMKVSSHGIALIMNFEGLRTAAYKPVIAYGADEAIQSICEYLGYEYASK